MSTDSLQPFGDPFADLEQSYRLGNMAAIFDVVTRSSQTGQGIPDWAMPPLQDAVLARWKSRRKQWKGSHSPLGGGYMDLLGKYLRAEVYRAVMLWINDKRNYKGMPTTCIQAWYDKKLDGLPNTRDGALELALRGLKGTFIANTSRSVLESQSYFGADADADTLVGDNPDAAEALEMSMEEYRAFTLSSLRDRRRLPISFGYNETEVIFGLRSPGQFWGPPPGSPPTHIQAIIDTEPQTMDDNS